MIGKSRNHTTRKKMWIRRKDLKRYLFLYKACPSSALCLINILCLWGLFTTSCHHTYMTEVCGQFVALLLATRQFWIFLTHDFPKHPWCLLPECLPQHDDASSYYLPSALFLCRNTCNTHCNNRDPPGEELWVLFYFPTSAAFSLLNTNYSSSI